jgi:hypothetical protein
MALTRFKAWFGRLSIRVTFAVRRARIKLAVRLARPVDGMVTSKAVYLQGMTLLAELTGRIEKSGILKGQPAKLAQIEREVEKITQALVDAQRIGDPSLQLEDVQTAYVNARIRSLPKRQRQELEHRRALIDLSRRGEAVGRARTAPAPDKATTATPAGVVTDKERVELEAATKAAETPAA